MVERDFNRRHGGDATEEGNLDDSEPAELFASPPKNELRQVLRSVRI
ncbi:hypothetical protein [Halomicrococcus sp. NG-SE-24]